MRMISGSEVVREVIEVAKDGTIDLEMMVGIVLLLQRLQLDRSRTAPGASLHSRHNGEVGSQPSTTNDQLDSTLGCTYRDL